MFRSIVTMKRAAVCGAAVLCLSLGFAERSGATSRVRVGITNNSSYDIYELHISSTGDNNRGRDLLGRFGVLESGASTGVTAEPGRYDLKLVDEDGDECVVRNLGLYGDQSWNITDRRLLSCEFHR